MRELLSNPVMQEALLTLRDFNLPRDTEVDDADSVASVRRLSRSVGWNNCLMGFMRLGEPVKPPAPPEEPDYGATNEQ